MSKTADTQPWTFASIPDQSGRTAVITGANTGLGFETARILAEHGAEVVLASRNIDKAADAAARLRNTLPDAKIHTQQVDLASLASIHGAARQLRADHPRIDLLINNAGGINTGHTLTVDGFESTFTTNHLGPFALTGLLLDRLLGVPGSRVVTVSSNGHRRGAINLDDLQLQGDYRYTTAYYQSKLANLMFTYELQRRLTAAGGPTIAVAAHPGNARTAFGNELNPAVRALMHPRLRVLTWWLMQTRPMGALAIVRAAVDPTARGADYYGPPGRAQFTGYPVRVDSSDLSHDTATQFALWTESERLSTITYPALTKP